MTDKFEVTISKKDFIPFLLSLSAIESILILGAFFSKHTLLGTVFAIIFFAIGFIAVLSTFLFCVKVEKTTINVSTRLGKRYVFNCSDIEEVVCSKRTGVKYGTSYYITLFAKSHELTMEGTMAGFEIMAKYILDKYEAGEIKRRAISEECKKILIKYQKGDLYKKKKRNI